jgi:DNA-binding transcriptional LysR family regulator
MHRRHGKRHVPIELLRALAAIVDTGSFTKAAELLDLTQSGVSAQMRRLVSIVGGEVFESGVALSKRGNVVVAYARRILTMNDELLNLAGPRSARRQLLVGLPAYMTYRGLIRIFTRCSESGTDDKISFRCDSQESLIRDLIAGTLDLAYLCNVSESPTPAVVRWSEPIYWVKARKLTLDPTAPVPLVSWSGTNPDRVAIKALQENDIPHSIAFSGAELATRLAAVAAGLGVMAIRECIMTPDLVIATESFLPNLPETKTGLFAREGLDVRRIAPFLRTLETVLRPKPVTEKAVAPAPTSLDRSQRRKSRGSRATTIRAV